MKREEVKSKIRGDNNPSKRPEVRLKMSLAAKNRSTFPITQLHRPEVHARSVETFKKNHRLRSLLKTKVKPYSILNQEIRKTSLYFDWRKRVFERDDYTCILCGVRGVKLEADHITRFSDILKKNKINSFSDAVLCEKLWDVKNGRTLCIPCHRSTPTWGRQYCNPTSALVVQ